METIVKLTRQGIISGEYAKAFLECMSLFPVGSVVELSNKCIGKVVRLTRIVFKTGRISDYRSQRRDSSGEQDLF